MKTALLIIIALAAAIGIALALFVQMFKAEFGGGATVSDFPIIEGMVFAGWGLLLAGFVCVILKQYWFAGGAYGLAALLALGVFFYRIYFLA